MEDDKPTGFRAWAISAKILKTAAEKSLRHMPLDLDNGLPAMLLQLSGPKHDGSPCKVNFLAHLDSCAAMNTGNLLVHQWLITKYPEIVVSYEEHDDANPFCPITLECAVDVSSPNARNLLDKLTAVVTYKTGYTDDAGEKVHVSFGLGAGDGPNAIIGIPTFKKWKIVLDISSNMMVAKSLNKQFSVEYANAVHGLPPSIQFVAADFVRPKAIATKSSSNNSPSFHIHSIDEEIIALSTNNTTQDSKIAPPNKSA